MSLLDRFRQGGDAGRDDDPEEKSTLSQEAFEQKIS